MCTSYSLFVIGVIFFDLTILVCLLSIYALQSSSTPLRLYFVALLMVVGLLSASSSDLLFLLSGSESEE